MQETKQKHNIIKIVNDFIDKYAGTGEWLIPKSARNKLTKDIDTLLSEERATIREEIENMKIEYSDGLPNGDKQALKYKNHKELGYNKALDDIINILDNRK